MVANAARTKEIFFMSLLPSLPRENDLRVTTFRELRRNFLEWVFS